MEMNDGTGGMVKMNRGLIVWYDSLSEMLKLVSVNAIGIDVLATKNTAKSTTVLHRTKPASVSLFFMNGDSSCIKIVANVEGIQALRNELEEAEKALRRNKSYLFGDPLWWRGNSKFVAIEPTAGNAEGLTTVDNETEGTVHNPLGPKLLLGSVVVSVIALTIVGAMTVCGWVF